MLTKRLIPSLLLRDGRLVKGRNCRDYRDAGNPATTIRALCAQGADEIILLDLSEGAPSLDILEAVGDVCTVPICFGGGIRTSETAREAFRRGADKIYLGGSKQALAKALSESWGAQAIVLGCDVTNRAQLPATDSEVRLLSVAHEGTRKGMDTDLIRWAAQSLTVPLIAEGGAGNLNHIAQAFRAGADAVALGAMLTFGDNNLVKLKRYLSAQGFPMRGV